MSGSPRGGAGSRKHAVRNREGLSPRAAFILGVCLLMIVGLAMVINGTQTADDAPSSTAKMTTTTREVVNSPLAEYERTLRMEVAAYVGYGQHVEELMRRPTQERSDSDQLVAESAPFVEIMDKASLVVEKLAAPQPARQAREYALQSGAVLRSSLNALRDGLIDPEFRVQMSARLKLIADRVFDRARVSLERAARPDSHDAAERLRVQSTAPDYSADAIAPIIDGASMPAPSSERPIELDAWRRTVSEQARVITGALSPTAPDAAAMARSIDVLALHLADESVTEVGRAFRLAALVGLESALARERGALTLADALAAQCRELWRVGAMGVDVPQIDVSPVRAASREG